VNLEGALTWAFEFEDQPYFAGFRVLASNGIDLPVMNVFRMFSRMNGKRVAAKSSGEVPLESILNSGVRGAPDVAALASVEPKKLCVMVWHYHDDDVAGPEAEVDLTLDHLPIADGNARLTHYRIDQTHSNAHSEWKRLGAPIAPNNIQYATLQKAGHLAELAPPGNFRVKQGNATLRFSLPRQAVSLLILDWD